MILFGFTLGTAGGLLVAAIAHLVARARIDRARTEIAARLADLERIEPCVVELLDRAEAREGLLHA